MAKKANKKAEAKRETYPKGTSKYRWAEWANGAWHKLNHGVDFQVSIESFRIQACRWAVAHGYFGHTRKISDTTIIVAFTKTDDAPGGEPVSSKPSKTPAPKKVPAKKAATKKAATKKAATKKAATKKKPGKKAVAAQVS